MVGMHRSGTALVARLVRALGVDLGRRISDNAEDIGVVDLHEQLMRRAGGSWEYPQPLLELLEVPEFRREATRRVARYAARHRSAEGLWGWKDPRGAFTLPLWRDVCGTVPMVVVRRDGRDVAASLAHRARVALQRGEGPFAERSLIRGVADALRHRGQLRFDTVRCWSPDRALALWGEYNAAIDRHLERCDDPVLALRHEDLVADPREQARRLADFLGAPPAGAEKTLQGLALRPAARRAALQPSAGATRAVVGLLRRYGYEVEADDERLVRSG